MCIYLGNPHIAGEGTPNVHIKVMESLLDIIGEYIAKMVIAKLQYTLV